MQNTQVSKSILARLLATENINVQYMKAPTASFNVGTRTLVLPIINDMTNDMHDLFIGHEVGHAIHTPIQYGEVQAGMPSGFGTFLNVVEDARIERQIKDQYPGLRKSFSKGYQDFMRMDFFELKGMDVNGLLLVDRINLQYKVGSILNIEFTSEEQIYVDKVGTCETFDDVVRVAKELFEYCHQEMEEKQEKKNQEKASRKYEFGDDSEDSDSDYGDDSEDSDDDDYSNDDYSDDYSDDDDSEPNEVGSYGGEVKSLTDENLQDSLRKLASSDKRIVVGNLEPESAVDYNHLVVPYSQILGKVFSEYGNDKIKTMPNEFLALEKKVKNSVLYLVKEFELRKRAAELRRMVVSDSGVIDTNKLHTYKFNDDIFRKFGSIPAGKNHGLVVFLDWSGSMCDNMTGTIEQLLTLILFCQKIKVPYEVYAFSTVYKKYTSDAEDRKSPVKNCKDPHSIQIDEYFSLINLFSSRMGNAEFRRMANDILHYAKECGNNYSHVYCHVQPEMRLGGTPLNSTIFAASAVVNRFRKAYKTEVVNVAFLTDGEDSSSLSVVRAPGDLYGTTIGESTRLTSSYIMDKETKKRYAVGPLGVTPTLLQILKDRTGCNLIGFYILSKNRRDFFGAANRLGALTSDESFGKFKSEKFFGIKDYGYDEYFLIPGGKDLEVEDENLDDLLGQNNTSVTARRLRGAFLKMNQNRLINRVLLSKVIEKIA